MAGIYDRKEVVKELLKQAKTKEEREQILRSEEKARSEKSDFSYAKMLQREREAETAARQKQVSSPKKPKTPPKKAPTKNKKKRSR